MNEQPHEWTVKGTEIVAHPSLWRFIVSNETQARTIADAHNAALAAEREKVKQAERTVAEYNEAAVFYELQKKCNTLVDALERIIMAKNIEAARAIVNDALANRVKPSPPPRGQSRDSLKASFTR
jgi:predicted DNA-binding protein YlxM (UPF0122 family)